MPAVVLDDEQADQQAGRRDGEEQGQPVSPLGCRGHDRQQGAEWRCGGYQLEQAALDIGAIGLELARHLAPDHLGIASGFRTLAIALSLRPIFEGCQGDIGVDGMAVLSLGRLQWQAMVLSA